jgi:ketosteroid isomerase-like protein
MSEENVELVRQGLEAFFVGDLERAMSSVHPDAVALRAPPLPDPQTYHGIEGVLQMYADWTTDFGEFEMAAGEFIDAGDRVAAEVFQRGRRQASGAVVEGRFWFVSRSLTEKPSAMTSSTTGTKPSKPPGCGIRRCRSRTWRRSSGIRSIQPPDVEAPAANFCGAIDTPLEICRRLSAARICSWLSLSKTGSCSSRRLRGRRRAGSGLQRQGPPVRRSGRFHGARCHARPGPPRCSLGDPRAATSLRRHRPTSLGR